MTSKKAQLVGFGLIPVLLLAVVGLLLTQSDLLNMLRPAPPVEEVAFERVVLSPSEITVDVVNGGADPVTVAQVLVDEAFWAFTITPSATLPRLGRATIRIPYPWVQDEAHEVAVMTETGLTFAHEIPVATVTPRPGPVFFGVFAAIGLYVGVIPVAIGLLWLPFLKRLEPRWIHFVLALTAGLLIFLAADALEEALEAASLVAGAFQGSLVVLLGVLGTFLLLQMLSRRRDRAGGPESRMALAFLLALAIGLHNLGEGLAIGAAYSLGEVALGAFLIVGFMLHNTTEGLAIVSPVANDGPRIPTLLLLGLLAGGPTIPGAWIGGLAYSPLYATLFLSIGVGAILQVLVALYGMIGGQAGEPALTPLNAGGVMTGLFVMYGTGLLVAI